MHGDYLSAGYLFDGDGMILVKLNLFFVGDSLKIKAPLLSQFGGFNLNLITKGK
jgi:hypothetical protein